MNRILFFIIFATFFIMSYSQRTSKVSATYTYYAPETMSVEEAKRVALDRAKIQAIADEFGTIVSQNTSTMVTNKNGDSDTQFFAIGGSEVKGEWIETAGDPEYDIKYEDHLLIVLAKVKGTIRERVKNKLDIDAKLLRNGTDQKYEATEFKNGDDMYLYFKSPSDGFIIVFLIDQNAKNVYSILPYSKDAYSAYEVVANQEYVFFSKKMAPDLQRAHVTEYTMTCDDVTEINDVVVVFSSSKLQLPKLKTINEGSLPPSIDYDIFVKWRTNAMKHCDLTINNLTLTIRK